MEGVFVLALIMPNSYFVNAILCKEVGKLIKLVPIPLRYFPCLYSFPYCIVLEKSFLRIDI